MVFASGSQRSRTISEWWLERLNDASSGYKQNTPTSVPYSNLKSLNSTGRWVQMGRRHSVRHDSVSVMITCWSQLVDISPRTTK